MKEAKFSFCFIRVALFDCLAFEDRLTTAQHVEQKLRTSSHCSMVLMCYRNYKDKICNTDVLRMQYACCYCLPVIQSPQLFMTSSIQTPLMMHRKPELGQWLSNSGVWATDDHVGWGGVFIFILHIVRM